MATKKDLTNINGGAIPNGTVVTNADNNTTTKFFNGKPVTFATTIDPNAPGQTPTGATVFHYDGNGNLINDTTPEQPTVPETPDTSGMEAYQKALASVMASYQQSEQARLDALQKNYNTALGQLQNSLNTGKDALKRDTDDALRQAYISYMLGQRGINQRLSNSGVNGGATESVLANLYNNYGNNRAAIQNAYQNGLADLVTKYNNNVANLGSTYNTNYADALDDYNKQVASTQNSYASALASALGKSNTSSGTNTNTGATHSVAQKDIVSALGNLKGNSTGILNFLNNLNDYTDEEKETMLYMAGIDPTSLVSGTSGVTGSTSGSNGSTSANVGTNTIPSSVLSNLDPFFPGNFPNNRFQ